MDTVLKLRELRARAGLTQEEVARASRIGVKTISSFESGSRVDSMKLSQLEAILRVYGVTLPQFFSLRIEHDLAPWEAPESSSDALARRLDALPPLARDALAQRISAMLDAAEAILSPLRRPSPPASAPQHASIH
jgi:transcriptional regulator with XRE-family HTH domain